MAAQISRSDDSIGQLYKDHGPWLIGWLHRRLGNVSDAADLSQDVFTRLLSRHRPPPLNQPRAYLSAIARGLVIDHWRKCELQRAWLETLARMPEQHVPSPETQAAMLETLVLVDRALDTLKPPVRAAFLLAQLDGLTCAQIAERLGVSRPTAERYVAQGARHCYAIWFAA